MQINDVVNQVTEELETRIREILVKHPSTIKDLAERLSQPQIVIERIIKRLRDKKINIHTHFDGRLEILSLLVSGGVKSIQYKERGDGWMAFGYVTDNHLCNRHARLDVLNEAYNYFEDNGVEIVFQAGNIIEGEARFNKQELVVRPGLEAQIEYVIDKFPYRKGLKTLFITGDDHEGWYIQRDGVNVGKRLEQTCKDAGRNDLEFLGHVEADIALGNKKKFRALKIMHPGGGSAYAFSYTLQKLVEAFQGGEKPVIFLCGHYHKWDYCYPREVHSVQGGCTCDPTMFMRKNKIAAHVGFSMIKIKQELDTGDITSVSVEWHPRYNLNLYENRFGVGVTHSAKS